MLLLQGEHYTNKKADNVVSKKVKFSDNYFCMVPASSVLLKGCITQIIVAYKTVL